MLVLGNGRTRTDFYLYYPLCDFYFSFLFNYISITIINTGLMPKGNSHICLVSCLSDLANYPTDCPFCKCFHFRKTDQTTIVVHVCTLKFTCIHGSSYRVSQLPTLARKHSEKIEHFLQNRYFSQNENFCSIKTMFILRKCTQF